MKTSLYRSFFSPAYRRGLSPRGPLQACAAALLTLPCSLTALAAQEEVTDLEDVVVLGSRATPRTQTETAAPVDVIHRDEIERTGVVETSKLLQFLAPSFNFSTSTISDGSDIVRPSSLRGLGPDQTLVLVNGKRRHNSALVHVNGSVGRGTAGTDLNAIPVSSIERIEILRDGAAAQYGSDAIAGVINIVLKQQTDDVEMNWMAGQTYEGDGEQFMTSVNGGLEIGDGGYANLTAEFRDRAATNRAGPDPRQQYESPTDPREASFDRNNHRFGDADSQNKYLSLNSALPVGSSSELYAFGGIARRVGESGGFYRRSLDVRNLPAVYPDGFLPLINTKVNDDSISLGFRSGFGQWDTDTSLTYGRNSFNYFVSNSLNVSLGPTSPTSADAGTLIFDQTTLNLDLKRSLDLWQPVYLALGAEYRRDGYQIEAGDFASYANGPDDDPNTAFPDRNGDPAAPGIQVFPGFRPSNEVDKSRDNTALYIDAESDVSENLLLGAAVRGEHYSDFGNTLNGKLSGRYAFKPGFALRGSVSTGFRAPSLQQQYFNNTSTQFVTVNNVPNTPVDVGTFANDSAVAKALGVPKLKEETSRNLSFGLVAQPTRAWILTADVYHIEIKDRVVLSGRFDTSNPVVAALLADFPGVTAAQFFTNAIDTVTDGVDLITSYQFRFEDASSLKLSLAANWTKTELDGDVRTPDTLTGQGETLFSRQEIIWLEDGQPASQINLASTYMRGGFTGLIRFTRFGEVKSTESASDPSKDQTFSAKWLTDADLSYNFGNGLTWAVGANNLFDVTPDKNIEANSFNGIFPYNRRTSPFGFNGGFYYTKLTYLF